MPSSGRDELVHFLWEWGGGGSLAIGRKDIVPLPYCQVLFFAAHSFWKTFQAQ